MKKPSFFFSSLFLSINRYIGKVGSVAIMAILGRYDPNVLSAFFLLFTAISIFFTGIISAQIGLQSEFARLRAQNLDSTGLLAGSVMLFGGIAVALCLGIWLMGADYFIRGTNDIFRDAKACFALLAFSIPLLALNNVLAMFLEGNNRAATISKVRIGQVVAGIFFIACIAIFTKLALLKVVLVYVALDATALGILIGVVYKKQWVSFSRIQWGNIKRVLRPFVIGAPAALCQAMTTYAVFKLTSMVAHLGVTASTTLPTIIGLGILLQVPIIGISQQVGLDVAQQHSLKKPIWASMKKGLAIILSITLVGILLLLLFRSSFAAMLTGRHPMTGEIFLQSIVSVCCYLIVSISLLFLLNLLRACGDYVVPQVLAMLFGAFSFVCYTTFIHEPTSFSAILNTYIAFNGLSAIVLLIRFLSLNKIRLNALIH